MPPVLSYYLAAVNIYAFFIFFLDKSKAKRGARRVSERHLMASALLGGSIGAFLAMKIFRHKTQHTKFALGVPLILIIHGLVIFLLYKH